jgi:hypothetical protein
MAPALETPERVVWARNNVASNICPRSFITAQSMAWLEDYLVRRKLGRREVEGLGAREVEAFLILEHELTQTNGSPGAGNRNSGPEPRERNA